MEPSRQNAEHSNTSADAAARGDAFKDGKHFAAFFVLFCAFLLSIALAILVDQRFAIGIPLIMLAGIFVLAWWQWALARHSSKIHSEAEDNAEWARIDDAKKRAIKMTRELFPRGPVGAWLFSSVSYPRYGQPQVYHEKRIVFRANGTGTYSWWRRDPLLQVETVFQWKRESEETLLVQVTSPCKTDWHSTDFVFEVHREGNEDFKIELWLAGENPLEEVHKCYWPFDEETFDPEPTPTEAPSPYTSDGSLL